MTATKPKTPPKGKPDMTVLEFFNVATDRTDGWNDLSSAAVKLSNAQLSGKRDKDLEAEVKETLASFEVFESFWAYPGLALFNDVVSLFKEGDFSAFATAVQRVTRTLMSGGFRRSPEAWNLSEDLQDDAARLPDFYEQRDFSRPYFCEYSSYSLSGWLPDSSQPLLR